MVTHISGQPSAADQVQDRESSPVRDRRSTTVLRHQPYYDRYDPLTYTKTDPQPIMSDPLVQPLNHEMYKTVNGTRLHNIWYKAIKHKSCHL